MPSPKRSFVLLLSLAAFIALPSFGIAMEPPQKTEKATPTRHELGESLKLRVQPFKKNMSEITLFGGNYLGDKWSNTWDAGAMYTFYFNDTFGVAASYTYSMIYPDRSSTFGANLRKDGVHAGYGALIINNDIALRAGSSIVQCDLFATLGGGSIQINDIWKYLLVVGGGIRVYTGIPWFAVRFDVNSFMHPTPGPGGAGFNADILMNLGFSFMLPPRQLMRDPTTHQKVLGPPEKHLKDQSSESLEGK